MALVGYARVSTKSQDPALQVTALREAGCGRVFVDHGVGGATAERADLAVCLAYLRDGDVLVVWKLDRLGRSLRHLVDTLHGLAERSVGFRSVTEALDTTTASGRLLFSVMGALAEFERDLIQERVTAGLAAARAKGRHGGRPRTMTPRKINLARSMRADQVAVPEIAATLGVSPATVYRVLAEQRQSA